jgi:hypothetical protein
MGQPTVYTTLAARFLSPAVSASALLGSRARGDAGTFSDIDILLLVRPDEHTGDQPESQLIDGNLVNVSRADSDQVEQWFTSPEAATTVVQGLRDASILFDPEGLFAAIQRRAVSFSWDETMREKAGHWVSIQNVGGIEEVFKGLAGLEQNHVGRLLQARHGVSWGLNHVMQVHLGVLVSGDNGFFEEVGRAVGRDSSWTRHRDRAFGVLGGELVDQVRAGLKLYVETARLVADVILPQHKELITHAVEMITR